MIELNVKQTQCVAGGELVYVTEEWKYQSAVYSGFVMGLLGAVIGGGLMVGSSISAAATMGGVVIGALIGYSAGYGLSSLENMSLENNTWYDFTYIVVYN